MTSRSHVFLLASSLATCFTLLAGPATAWEFAYGPPITSEQAYRRVTPVDCPAPIGRGFISIGTVGQDVPDPDVYVVFTDVAGVRVWEIAYDVEGLDLPDEGVAIAQLPNASGGGFVFLSNSWNGNWRPALTEIRCDGRVNWSRIYPEINGHDLRGRDLIRAANGHYAVAGVGAAGLGADAFLMRTNAAGLPLWHLYYDAGGEEAFNALTEAAPQAGQAVGDLVAVGRFNDFNADLQGLVARVDGATGAIGGFPQCFVQHGSPLRQDVYNSVAALTDPFVAGEFALAGTTTGNPGQADLWLGRGNPCGAILHSRIGNGGGVTEEEAFDIREAAAPAVGPVGGLLAIAGAHGNGFGAPYDAAFLEVGSVTLLPFGASGRLFGDHGFRHEAFSSLAVNPAGWPQGYILAGYTETDWQWVGDPRDLYLVQHSPLAPAACEEIWRPDGFNYQEEELELLLLQSFAVTSLPAPAPAVKLDTGIPVCPWPGAP